MTNKARSIDAKRKKTKQALLEILEKMPIIESACQKVGITRMTLHRWRKDDIHFDESINQALMISRLIMNDCAEFGLGKGVENRAPWAIKYWLSNNHKQYATREKAILLEKNESSPIKNNLLQRALKFALPKIFKRKRHD